MDYNVYTTRKQEPDGDDPPAAARDAVILCLFHRVPKRNGVQRPDLLVVLDNQCYGSTGCQLTATSRAADLAAIATGAGVCDVRRAGTISEVRSGVHGSGVLVVTVDPGNADVPIIDMEPGAIKRRFMQEISGV